MDAADVTYMYIKKVKKKMDLFFTHALMTFGDSGRITHYEKVFSRGKNRVSLILGHECFEVHRQSEESGFREDTFSLYYTLLKLLNLGLLYSVHSDQNELF